MSAIVLDIETAADEELVGELLAAGPPEPFEAPANYKDPAKIAGYIADADAQWRASVRNRAALSPRTGRVICVGWAWVDASAQSGEVRAAALAGPVEAELIEQISVLIDGDPDTPPRLLVTFNGLSFDAPYIRLRAARLGLVVPGLLRPQPRYRLEPHLDLRMLLTDHDQRALGRLTDWCAFLRTPRRPDLSVDHGAGIQAMVDGGDWAGIERLCVADVEATADLYLACAPLLAL